MKKILLVLFGLLIGVGNITAQVKTISGTITSAEDQLGLPGVSILVKGTYKGTISDLDGKYNIDAVQSSDILIFKYVGFETQEISVGDKRIIDLIMSPDAQVLDEVVVTALGIKREKKSIGYSVQEVQSEELMVTRDASVINQLTGKVSGLQISSTNSGSGSSSRIVLRGNNSFSGNNQALIVVDGVPIENNTISNAEDTWGGRDYGNGISDINPDDIESVSVLKGASASALYGSKAANGVILVTTKKGKERKGIGVSFTNNTSIDQPYILYDFQNTYGGGRNGTFTPPFEIVDGVPKYNTTSASAYGSWGPRMEGQEIIDWDGKKYSYDPQPDNYKNYFQNGITFNNAISLDGGIKNLDYRVSLADLRTREIVPNASFSRTNIGLNLNARVLKKFEIKTYIAYARQKVNNRFDLADSHDNVNRNYIMMPRHIRNGSMQNYLMDDDGNEQTWYMNWAWQSNPYYHPYYRLNGDEKDRVFGHASLTYHLTEHLDLMIRTAPDYSVNKGYQKDARGGLVSSLGYYGENEIKQFLINSDFLVTYHNNITENISYTINLGGNAMYQRWDRYDGHTNGGLFIDGDYSLDNSVDEPYRRSTFAEKAINSIYGFGQIDYKHYLFLDLTGRNDWSSTLPAGNNSYFYPSVSLGFVFTELITLSKKGTEIFSFGKLRVSYAEVGNDADPYQLNPTFFIDSTSNVYGTIAYLTNKAPPLDLKPERTKSIEIGTDLRFFMNRLSLDLTWYKTNSVNQIVSADISQASGSVQALINAGNIENKGIEIQLKAVPVKREKFQWDFIFNFNNNKSMVLELDENIDNLQLLEHWNLSIEARPGHPYGDIVGYAILRDAEGNKLIDKNGMYIRNEVPQVLGNVNPDFSLSWFNNISWQQFTFSFFIDARIGGEMFAGTNMYGYGYSGNFEETLEGRESWYASENARMEAGLEPEDWIATGGYLAEGVYTEGTTIDGDDVGGQTNHTYVNPELYWDQFSEWTNEIHEPFVYDASFVKLRELILTYDFPLKWISKLKMKKASLSVYCRNLWIIYKAVPNIDPETFHTNGNGQGYELYSYPNKRSIGFSLNLNF